MIQLQNITICGIKHAGKTCAARALSDILHVHWHDTDDVLRELYNEKYRTELSVREIYRTLGEDAFRRLEADAVAGLCRKERGIVIALGGGVLSNPYLAERDRAGLGMICWLDVSDEVAFERVKRDGLPPFLAVEPDPFQTFCRQNANRRIHFQKYASVRIECGGTPDRTAHLILEAYRKQQKETKE